MLLPAAKQAPFASALASPEHLHTLLTAVVSGQPGGDNCVYRVPVGNTACYVKLYREPSRWGRSRGRQEWRNLQYLEASGVATPTLLGFGVWFEQGCRYTVLVTAQVDGACDLSTCVNTMPERFSDARWFQALCDSLAPQLRKMHDAGFAHNDLNWRNILVLPDAEQPRTWVFDCPSGRRWVWPFLNFRIAKDLTHLDKMGRRWLRATQRMRFFMAYCGHRPLQRADKQLARTVLRRTVNAKYQPVQRGH